MKTSEYLEKSTELILDFNDLLQGIFKIEDNILLQKPTLTSWSAAEVISHININNSVYFPRFEEGLSKSVIGFVDTDTKLGLWGKKLFNMLNPENMGKKRYKTPKVFQPTEVTSISQLMIDISDS